MKHSYEYLSVIFIYLINLLLVLSIVKYETSSVSDKSAFLTGSLLLFLIIVNMVAGGLAQWRKRRASFHFYVCSLLDFALGSLAFT